MGLFESGVIGVGNFVYDSFNAVTDSCEVVMLLVFNDFQVVGGCADGDDGHVFGLLHNLCLGEKLNALGLLVAAVEYAFHDCHRVRFDKFGALVTLEIHREFQRRIFRGEFYDDCVFGNRHKIFTVEFCIFAVVIE